MVRENEMISSYFFGGGGGADNNYLITVSEVVTGKSQSEASAYRPSDSEVNTLDRGLRFSGNDRTVELIWLFIIWHKNKNKIKERKLA